VSDRCSGDYNVHHTHKTSFKTLRHCQEPILYPSLQTAHPITTRTRLGLGILAQSHHLSNRTNLHIILSQDSSYHSTTSPPPFIVIRKGHSQLLKANPLLPGLRWDPEPSARSGNTGRLHTHLLNSLLGSFWTQRRATQWTVASSPS
jgi:hypothetical protein